MYALNLAKDGRILSATYPRYAPNAVIVDILPDGDISDYRYENGEYVYDPLPKPENPEIPTSNEVSVADMATAIMEGVNEV